MITSPAFIEGVGGSELMVILFVVLLLFGADRLPEVARGIGKTVREFRKAASGVEEELRRAMEEEPPKKFPTHPPVRPGLPTGPVGQGEPPPPAPPAASPPPPPPPR